METNLIYSFVLNLSIFLDHINATYKNIFQKHKELLEINVSIVAYIEESKKRISSLRLKLADDANSAHKVADILSK